MYRNNGRPTGINSPGWEVRPGKMLVQKRTSDQNSSAPATIKVAVNYGSSCFDIRINPHASSGSLKKMVGEVVGLHPQDQQMFFMNKEMDSISFLDTIGVINGSKILVIEEQMNMKKSSQSITQIGYEIDKLSNQVMGLEDQIKTGENVVEKSLTYLTEQLMTQLIKLDGISAYGRVKQHRRMQVKRVQKYIEILDSIKMNNRNNQNMEHMYHQRQMITKMIAEKQIQNNLRVKTNAQQCHKMG